MRVTFLGTAAAEGFPAVFCNCRFCKEARILGGKNLRTRSQSLVNDDLLIDLPADTYHHFLMNHIEGHKIKYLFVTHPHQDHFYPEELKDPARVERILTDAIPKEYQTDTCHRLVDFGRDVCRAQSPRCDACPSSLKNICTYNKKS